MVSSTLIRPHPVRSDDVSCASCNLRDICLPMGLTRNELDSIGTRLVSSRRRVARGEFLFRADDVFVALHAVWLGFFKTCLCSIDGRSQVTGFQMGGDLLGLDGIHTGRHQVDAVALEDSLVCVLPFRDIQQLAQEMPSLQQQLQRAMSRELVQYQESMMVLGSMFAEERLAAFLLNLTDRLRARGFSHSALLLRMTRDEIASFLGLSIETISRTFSKFQAQGLLFVRSRQITITDPVGLRLALDGAARDSGSGRCDDRRLRCND